MERPKINAGFWAVLAGVLIASMVSCGGEAQPDPATPSGSPTTTSQSQGGGDEGPAKHAIPGQGQVPSDKAIDRRHRTALAPDTLDSVKTASRAPKTSKEVYRAVAPATVIVRVPGGMGSGVIVDKAGWVLTNHHVVDGGDKKDFQVEVTVLTGDLSKATGAMKRQEKGLKGTVYKVDKLRDLALVKLHDPPKNLPTVPIAAKKPVPGDRVVSIGHAGAGMLWAIKAGEVSALGKLSEQLSTLARFKDDDEGKKASEAFKKRLDKQNLGLVIQSTCNILPGDSGGPLVDQTGALVGVNAFSHKDPRTGGLLSFHIHLNEIKNFIKDKPKKAVRLLPDPWQDGGANLQLDDADLDGLVDVLVLRGRRSCRFCPLQSEAVMIDVDQDSYAKGETLPPLLRIYEKRSFDAELVFLRVQRDAYLWYDTDNDGKYDMLLYDKGTTGVADAVYQIGKDGDLTRDTSLKRGRLVRMSAFKSAALRKRMANVADAVFPERFRESTKATRGLPDPIPFTGTGLRTDLDGDGRPDAVKSNTPFTSRLLIDADSNFVTTLPSSFSMKKVSESHIADVEVSVISQGQHLWAWYDQDDDGKFDLVLHSPGQRLYVATEAWSVDAAGKHTPVKEHLGRKLLRPDLMNKKPIADSLRGMVGKGLLSIMSSSDDGMGTFPDPVEDHRGAGFRLMEVAKRKKTVVVISGQGSDGMLLDLDESSLRGKTLSKVNIREVVKDGKLDAELAYFHRNGLAWVFYDTRNRGRYDLVVYSSAPRGGNIELAYRIDAKQNVTLDPDLVGKPMVQPVLLKSALSRQRLQKVAPELFSAAMLGK